MVFLLLLSATMSLVNESAMLPVQSNVVVELMFCFASHLIDAYDASVSKYDPTQPVQLYMGRDGSNCTRLVAPRV